MDDDHRPENLHSNDTEVLYDSDCVDDDRVTNDRAFEYEEEMVLDSEDEDVNGSRFVVVPKSSNALEIHSNACSVSEQVGKFGNEMWSQTEECSQTDDALDFVDRFVSNNQADQSQEICARKTFKEKSLTVLGLNGRRNLAQKISRRGQAKGRGPFEWFDCEGGTEYSMKDVNSISDFGGLKPNGVLCPNEETGSGFDVKQLEDNAIVRDSLDDYDIGFNTQLAVEAIQTLGYEDPFSYKASGVVGTTFDESSRAVMQNDSQLTDSCPRMSVCNDLEEALRSVTRKKRSGRKLGSCVEKRGVTITENNIIPLTANETSSVANVQPKKRFEKVYSRSRRCRQSSSGVSLKTSDNHLASKVREKTNSEVERGVIVYERKRRRVSANLFEVLEINGGSKVCDSSDRAKKSKLTGFSNLGVWNFPRGKRSKTTSVTGKNSASFDHAFHTYKRRNKCATKKPISKELVDNGVLEIIPESTRKALRRRKDISIVRVLLSQHLDNDVIKQQKKVAARLGIPIVSCCMEATHFVADKFARTKNMLEAIALGKPVVTCHWLIRCGEANCFTEEKNYILRDARKEKELGLCLPVSLARANKNPLLKDQRVLVTRNVKPGREMIMNLVKAVQGQVVEEVQPWTRNGKNIIEKLLILSCEEDHQTCIPFLHKGVAIYSPELLLNGIVTQKLDYKRHQLFSSDIKSKGVTTST